MTNPSTTPSRNSSYWDARFLEEGYAYGEAPNTFLVDAASQLEPGRALCLCEGEGRNAVHLARMGFAVTAVDFSSVGLAKARELAARHGVSIDTICQDIADLDLGRGKWSLIAAIFAQPDTGVRRRLFHDLHEALAPGGAFILESKVEADAATDSRYPGVAVLVHEMAPLAPTIAREGTRLLAEGRYHDGLHHTAQILAFRPT